MKKLGVGSFQLEPDGFSIHTLEVVKRLSNKDYKRIRDRIYQQCPKGEIYSDRSWQGEGGAPSLQMVLARGVANQFRKGCT